MILLALLPACGTPLDPADGKVDDTGVETGQDSGDTGGYPEGLDLDAPDGGFLYTEDHILDFGIELDDAAIAALAADPRTDVHATFRFGPERYDVGLHLKGNRSFRTLDEKAAFKIDFGEFVDDQELHGVRRLTLNNMVLDPSMLSEHVAYELYGALGVPSPRHGSARVTVNGEWYGLYGIVETMDEQFLARVWEDDAGNLYEGGYGGDFREGCADLFTLQEAGTPKDGSDLVALVDAVVASTPDTFLALLDGSFAVDPLLDLWAAELATANPDAYTTLANNFYVYHEPTADRWWMTPWGPDQAFVDEVPVAGPYYGQLAANCDAVPECRARMDEHLDRVLATWEEMDLSGWAAAEAARIEADCRDDPRSEYGDYGCRDAQAALVSWIAARPDAVRAQTE